MMTTVRLNRKEKNNLDLLAVFEREKSCCFLQNEFESKSVRIFWYLEEEEDNWPYNIYIYKNYLLCHSVFLYTF